MRRPSGGSHRLRARQKCTRPPRSGCGIPSLAFPSCRVIRVSTRKPASPASTTTSARPSPTHVVGTVPQGRSSLRACSASTRCSAASREKKHRSSSRPVMSRSTSTTTASCCRSTNRRPLWRHRSHVRIHFPHAAEFGGKADHGERSPLSQQGLSGCLPRHARSDRHRNLGNGRASPRRTAPADHRYPVAAGSRRDGRRLGAERRVQFVAAAGADHG